MHYILNIAHIILFNMFVVLIMQQILQHSLFLFSIIQFIKNLIKNKIIFV